jgi:hypothetical protein
MQVKEKSRQIEVNIVGMVRDTESRPFEHAWVAGWLDENQVARIVELSEIVKKNHLYCVEFFDGTVDVYDGLSQNKIRVADVFCEDMPEDALCDRGDPELQDDVECMTCHVTDVDVYWTWCQHHGDSGTIECYGFPIDALVAALELKRKKEGVKRCRANSTN